MEVAPEKKERRGEKRKRSGENRENVGVYDARKRRVTDLKECARVTLPKPLTVTEEAKIELRREIYRKKYSEHKEVKTKNGEQISNLTPAEI